jgi:hypothetical protein
MKANACRGLWHDVLRVRQGLEPVGMVRDEASPGNVDYAIIKTRGGIAARASKIARYISKYLAKELCSRAGRRSYTPSKNLSVHKAQSFYLAALTPEAARLESLELVGVPGELRDFVKFWNPPESTLSWVSLQAAFWPD